MRSRRPRASDQTREMGIRSMSVLKVCRAVAPTLRCGRQAELVPDEVDAIAGAVRAASAAADVVVTSGGLGPTPDDVTMAGVAAALGHPLGRHAPACKPWSPTSQQYRAMAGVAAVLGHPLGRHAAACKPYPVNPCKTVTVAGVAAALGNPLGRHAAPC